MKLDYRFRDLDAQPITPVADAGIYEALCKPCNRYFVNQAAFDAHTVSNHSRVSDVVPNPENVSQSEIEQLRAINAQLVAALREFVDYYSGNKSAQLGNGQARRSLEKFRAALNAAEKESNK